MSPRNDKGHRHVLRAGAGGLAALATLPFVPNAWAADGEVMRSLR